MAFRDSWHRALVYFGLAEERAYVDEYAEEREQHAARERQRARERPAAPPRAGGRDGGRLPRAPERSPARAAPPAPRRLRRHLPRRRAALRPPSDDHPASRRAQARNGDVRVHLVIPKSFNDAQQVADKFKQSIPVVLNLQGTDTELSKRLIDFASGLTYALDGGMQRIAEQGLHADAAQRADQRRGAGRAHREGLLQPVVRAARGAELARGAPSYSRPCRSGSSGRATWRLRSRAAGASRSPCSTSPRRAPRRSPRSSAVRSSTRPSSSRIGADVVVLCHKPAGVERVASSLSGEARGVISILGGVAAGRAQGGLRRDPGRADAAERARRGAPGRQHPRARRRRRSAARGDRGRAVRARRARS